MSIALAADSSLGDDVGRVVAELKATLLRKVRATGHRQPAAGRLYDRAGFRRCPPVLDCPPPPYAVVYAKTMARADSPA
jgi:hypothetical protein